MPPSGGSVTSRPWPARSQNSTETLEKLEHAFDNIKRRLFSELHSVVREQIFPAAAPSAEGGHVLQIAAPQEVAEAVAEAAKSER